MIDCLYMTEPTTAGVAFEFVYTAVSDVCSGCLACVPAEIIKRGQKDEYIGSNDAT